jgi:glycosyltransferase involved in cell wall biosynthesis
MPRALLVAYYMPPAGGPAVQRILQFVEHLREEGWALEVLTVRDGAYPNRDPALCDAVPSGVRVHRTRSLDPYAVYQALTGKAEEDLPTGSMTPEEPSWTEHLARWVRANVFLPDARVGWWPFAVWRGRQLLDTRRFDALITSGAPHSVHLTGSTLQRWTGTPWVADLHDPWTDISYYDDLPHTRWARRLDAALERHVLGRADAVTTVSPSWADLFAQKAENDYYVVENGFDTADFEGIHEVPDTDSFVLAHVGKLYASRNPTALWDALASLRSEGAIPDHRLQLVGTVDPVVRQSLQNRDLLPVVEDVGFVPHDEALRHMARSTLLLLVIEQFAQAEGMITSKLYEYLASGRPVLGVGPPTGDANALLQRHSAGEVVERTDAAQIREVVRTHYDAWARGEPLTGASVGSLREHTRRHQARRMARVLNDVTGRSTAGPKTSSPVLD